MKIRSEKNPKDYEVGVIIGRFQVNKLHSGHRDLINYASENHRKVIILLGISRVHNTRKNPLDFASRKAMIQKEYPNVMILPIRDQRYNEQWSKDVDSIISVPYGEKSTVIYGSRDSFIPYYSGKYDVIELEESETYNGTNIREEVAKETLNSDDFRSGIIYSVYNNRETGFLAVDVITHDGDGNILLGRKPGEKYLRMIGGFFDVKKDKSIEDAVLRELNEETGGNLVVGRKPKYITSQVVNDWRYRGTEHGIVSALYLVARQHGYAKASDDIDFVSWIKVRDLSNFDGIRTKIVPEHREMLTTFINKIYDENLIPGIGERLEEVTNITYTAE